MGEQLLVLVLVLLRLMRPRPALNRNRPRLAHHRAQIRPDIPMRPPRERAQVLLRDRVWGFGEQDAEDREARVGVRDA